FNAGVHRVGIRQRRLEMPHPLEFPGMRRAIIPLVRAWQAVVYELIVDGIPGLAAIIRSLDHLPEPSARLRRIQPVRVGGRALHMVNLPAREERSLDIPLLALTIRC